jgi:uncharacterized protein (DUF2249 family)
MTKTVELDVRPHLKKKLEPFQIIMDTVKTLQKEDLFVLHATFKPTPLLGLMKTKGFHNKVEKRGDEHWVTTFAHKSMKHLLQTDGAEADDAEEVSNAASEQDPSRETRIFKLDNRGLEPPQPMIRTLSKLGNAATGDQVVIHNDRVPMFLIEELNTLGYPYSVENQEDGSAIVTITKT